MSTEPTTPSPGPEGAPSPDQPLGAVGDKAAEAYKWWDNLATLNPQDPWWVAAGKLGVRLLGVLVLLALSPLIVVGLIMAFIVAL